MTPYIDSWQDAVLRQPTWLKPHLEKACPVASKYREKCKKQNNPY
jgi:hypothetical protein